MNALRLVIIGGGSAGIAAAAWASRHDADVTLVNTGLPLGGACHSVSLAPSRFLAKAADLFYRSRVNPFEGLRLSAEVEDFRTFIAQKRRLIEELHERDMAQMEADLKGVTRIDGHARLIDRDTVEVNSKRMRADRIVIATGTAPRLPSLDGIEAVDALTEESLLDVDTLPASLLVAGASGMGLSTAQIFARLGTKVTVVEAADHILPRQMADLGQTLASFLREEGIEILTNARVRHLERAGDAVEVVLAVNGEQRTLRAERIAFAAHQRPNTEDLGLDNVGVELDADGFIKVDGTLKTSVDGIYAAGQVTGGEGYTNTSSFDGIVAAHNAVMRSKTAGPYTAVPFIVFTDPQIAGVGMDEAQARSQGFEVDTSVLSLKDVPAGHLSRETRGFIKLIRDRRSDHLLGARIIGPHAADVIMEAALVVRYGLTVREIVSVIHPPITFSEGFRLAAQGFFGEDRTINIFAR